MREELKKSILKRIDALQDGYRQNIGLIGIEGVGKSTLLSSLFKEFSTQPSLIPILFHAQALDFAVFCRLWIQALLRGILISQSSEPPVPFEELLSAAGGVVPKTTEKIKTLQKNLNRERNALIVRDLFALTSVAADETGKKVILMIDEFHLLPTLIEGDVFGLLGKEIMLGKRTLYLMTSSFPKLAQVIFRDKLSLLFSNFEVLALPSMNAVEFQDVAGQFEVSSQIPRSGHEFLYHLSRGIPLYQTMILQRAQENFERQQMRPEAFLNPSEDDAGTELFIKACTDELVDPRGRLSLFFEKRLANRLQSCKEYWLGVQILIALSRGYRKASDIALELNKKVHEIKKILAKMESEGTLVQNGTFFCLEDELFAFWLREIYAYRFSEVGNLLSATAEVPGLAIMQRSYQAYARASELTVYARLEALLKKFHNESVELNGKRLHLPHFSDVTLVHCEPKNLVTARRKEIRWGCQVALDYVEEKDVTAFLFLLKAQKRHFQKKILITLSGIDQNARLLAHELKIQIWDLKDLNILYALYHLPQLVIFSEEVKISDETTLGAMAQGIHTA